MKPHPVIHRLPFQCIPLEALLQHLRCHEDGTCSGDEAYVVEQPRFDFRNSYRIVTQQDLGLSISADLTAAEASLLFLEQVRTIGESTGRYFYIPDIAYLQYVLNPEHRDSIPDILRVSDWTYGYIPGFVTFDAERIPVMFRMHSNVERQTLIPATLPLGEILEKPGSILCCHHFFVLEPASN
jgi:hypothetical protein